MGAMSRMLRLATGITMAALAVTGPAALAAPRQGPRSGSPRPRAAARARPRPSGPGPAWWPTAARRPVTHPRRAGTRSRSPAGRSNAACRPWSGTGPGGSQGDARGAGQGSCSPGERVAPRCWPSGSRCTPRQDGPAQREPGSAWRPGSAAPEPAAPGCGWCSGRPAEPFSARQRWARWATQARSGTRSSPGGRPAAGCRPAPCPPSSRSGWPPPGPTGTGTTRR